jgi:ferredoxin/DNA-binding Lrp family transcriptional regulator
MDALQDRLAPVSTLSTSSTPSTKSNEQMLKETIAMTETLFRRLARHLDNLPGGYPPTVSGVELKILRRLFTPEEAELAVHLTIMAEPARVVARRAGISVDEASGRLERMAQKGLILKTGGKNGPPRYMALQFVVGIWENQVNRLDPELIRDVNDYITTLFNLDEWQRAPQMRTIPVERSLGTVHSVMDYERAEALIREQKRISVRNCICRQEHQIMGKGCDKPMESCLAFGGGVTLSQEMGISRTIDQAEALDILRRADEAGLVLQPSNSKNPIWICTCCGCCCQILKSFKRHPRPAEIVATPFSAVVDAEACHGCGICVDRCQMAALTMDGEVAVLDEGRCIGCGLCVSTCPSDAIVLHRKPASEQPRVPRTIEGTYLRLARQRGKFSPGEMAKMVLKSKVDRLLALGR